MSIASELATLAANKAAIKAAIAAKNPATAPTDSLAQWPEAIASIPSGGGLTGYTLTLVGDNHLTNSDKSAIAVSLADGTIEMYDTYNALYEAPPIVVQNAVAYRRFSLNTNFDSGCTPISEDTMLYMRCACLMRGTLVSLADGSEKPIEDIGWGDELLVWDFGRGETATARPLWIKCAERVRHAYRVRFAEGVTLDVTGPHGHRAFNMDVGRFEYLPRSVGDRMWTLQGARRVVGCELRDVDGECYNIITAGHLNLFANGVLTSCRLNNCRAFDAERMRWAERASPRHLRDEFGAIPDMLIDGLRLCEQPDDADDIVQYFNRLAATAKEA
ncbi:MAG: hypothetical protein IKE55_11005 [Kiritimatiellae bacterium]|nr:hypothetical protein [Kiritimatiellia bacterium]